MKCVALLLSLAAAAFFDEVSFLVIATAKAVRTTETLTAGSSIPYIAKGRRLQGF